MSKGKLFLKLIGCVVILLFCLVFVINMNEDPVDESNSFFPFLAAYVAFQIIIGYILPGIFVSSYDSLKEYFTNMMKYVAKAPSSLWFGLKRIVKEENKVEDISLQNA